MDAGSWLAIVGGVSLRLCSEQILEDVHIRFVTYQILRQSQDLHSAQLIHRDLKPSNILINSEC